MASPAPAPSLLYGWLSASIGNLPPGAELAIMVCGDEDHVDAGLPLVMERRGPLRVARVLGGERTSHADVVGADGPAVTGLLAALGDVPSDVLIVKDVLGASRLARDGGFRLSPHNEAPLLSLHDGFAAVVAERLTSHDRSDIRRRQRRLAELGELSCDVAATPDAVRLALGDVFRLHDLRWAARANDHSDLRTAADRAFQRAMCPAIAGSGRFVVHRLCVDGVAIAFRSTFIMGDRAFAYRTSFDPAFAKFGPARLLIHHVFLDLSNRGVREIELMGGDSQHKRELTDTKLILYSGVRRGSGRLGVIAAPAQAGANAVRVWLKEFETARAIHRRLVTLKRQVRHSGPAPAKRPG
jgi:CelD/BcsL family acetyltransferase involved in cellulose biosynthesis